MKPALANVNGIVIDMDGVLRRGSQALPGVEAFFTTLREHAIQLILATNNSTATPESVVTLMRGMGVAIKPEEMIGSAQATAGYLRQNFAPGTRVITLGEEALHNALREVGFRLVEDPLQADVVVSGFNRRLDYPLLTRIAIAIQNGAAFIGTNPDKSFPLEEWIAPGNGAILAALEATTGTAPVIIGKPEPHLYTQCLQRMGTSPHETLALGDRLDTDILGGQRTGMPTALVLTGISTIEDIEATGIHPDWIFAGLPELTTALQQARGLL